MSARDIEPPTADGRLTIPVAGEFDMGATFTVEPTLERALEQPGLRRLTVDLSDVTFIDSTGLGVVLRLATDVESRDVELELVPGPPEVQRVFESAGVLDVLPFTQAPDSIRRDA